ncbi:MAG TPA: response regulator [Sphingomonadales bacterium]|mgnify:CR=1 FL=1
MTIAEAILPHLPYLRRYSRALNGSQGSGDAYVRACLEAIVADPELMNLDHSPRTELYRIYHAIWNSSQVPDPDERAAVDEAELSRRLRRLVPVQRQALLLSAMEGFSSDEVADILGVDRALVPELVASALQSIVDHPPTEILIIEDEPVISLDLRSIVEDMGHRVTAVATTRAEAVNAARLARPGLVLADIQLADQSSGIDAVKDILADESLPVIFITAYPERLLTGERPEPTFLISKPFEGDAVKAAISQALYLSLH